MNFDKPSFQGRNIANSIFLLFYRNNFLFLFYCTMSSPTSAQGNKPSFGFDTEGGMHPKCGYFPAWEGTYRRLLTQKKLIHY